LQLNKGSNGTWYAEVEGNYGVYQVEIETDNKSNVTNYYCDCPYDGAICKHIAAIAMEGVKAIQYMDDSSGACGGAIYESFRVIENILNNKIADELKVRIFNWLHEQVQNPDYNNYGVGDSLESLFFETAASLKKTGYCL